jgi:GH15 family glucan-1,4-alpha-glucosidase
MRICDGGGGGNGGRSVRQGGRVPALQLLAVDALAATGRGAEARALFERLLSLRNDLGLLSEEYDVDRQRLVGNFPQAFTHLALVGSALKLDAAAAPQAPEVLPAAG